MSSAGQTSATACSPGYYQASSGQTSCDAADAGYYVSGTAQTSQTACGAGTYNSSTGSSSSSAGRCRCWILLPTSGQASQTACAAGTYQQAQVNPRVTMLMQATMFLGQPKRARLLVLPEPTTRAPAHPVHQPAQMPTLDITCQPPAKPARPLVPLEPLAARQDRAVY